MFNERASLRRCVKIMPTATSLPSNLTFYLIEKYGLESAARTAVIVGGVFLCMLIPYLLGSFNFGLIISRKKYNDDIRTHGSGNAGTTNMLRTYGKRAAVLTLLGDMLKAALAVGFGYLIADINTVAAHPGIDGSVALVEHYGAAIAGLFVMLGHMFPVFYKFKGGKGVATSGMVVLMISPISFVICFSIFAIIVLGTKFVSLASCMGMIFYPIILSAFSAGRNFTAQATAVLMATLVVFMHRENLKRLYNGTESKLYFSKAKRDAAAAEAAKKAEAVARGERPTRHSDPQLLDGSVTRSKSNRKKKK